MTGLRVIAGTARGRKLRAVPGDSTRPITDRTKESLFDILGADIRGADFLDLFGGTGAVGIEALSRGASFVRFLDTQRLAVATIKANLQTTQLSSSAEALKMDAFNFLALPPDRSFDYIYVAPPQYQEMWKKALRLLDRNPAWLASGGWVIAQIHPVELAQVQFNNFTEFDQRKYGSTLLIFYEDSRSDEPIPSG